MRWAERRRHCSRMQPSSARSSGSEPSGRSVGRIALGRSRRRCITSSAGNSSAASDARRSRETPSIPSCTRSCAVAYGQIPRADRAEKHQRAAVWIESFGRPEDYADLRAHHYASALEIARAGRSDTVELAQATRLALRDAGDRAASLNAFVAAARDYDRALQLWPGDDSERPRLLLSAAKARVSAEVWDPDELAAVTDALLAAGDRSRAAEAAILRAEVLWNLGRGGDVLEVMGRPAELAEELPRSATKARVYAGLFRLHWLANRVDLAEPFEAQALAMADELGLKEIRANVLSGSG